MNRENVVKSFALMAWLSLAHVYAQGPASPQNPLPSLRRPEQQQLLQRSSATDAARYLAGLSAPTPLAALTRDPRWIAHSMAMDAAFSKLNQRQLSNISRLASRIPRTGNHIQPHLSVFLQRTGLPLRRICSIQIAALTSLSVSNRSIRFRNSYPCRRRCCRIRFRPSKSR